MNQNNKKFLTFLPGCQNIHLSKDVGMIPFILYRDFQYDSYIASYENGEYPNLNEFSGLKMQFIGKHSKFLSNSLFNKTFLKKNRYYQKINLFIDSFVFFRKKCTNVDVIQFYHLTVESIFFAHLFHLLHGKSIIYLKLDMDPDLFLKDGLFSSIKNFIYKIKFFLIEIIPIDIISVETKILFEFFLTGQILPNELKKVLLYIPNGVDGKNELFHQSKNYNQNKENIILHTGRIGSEQKGSEIILEAFSSISSVYPDWELILFGSMESHFDSIFKRYSAINNLKYLGFLPSTGEVFEYYKRAKILAMPSRWESFGITLVEAGLWGNVVLGSKIPSIEEITDGGDLGYLCPVNDVSCFTETLQYLLSHEREIELKSIAFQQYIRENYDWNTICGNLNKMINQRYSIKQHMI